MSLFEGRGAPTAADRLVRAEQLEFVSPCGDQGSGDGRHLPVAYVGSVWAAQLEFVSPDGVFFVFFFTEYLHFLFLVLSCRV